MAQIQRKVSTLAAILSAWEDLWFCHALLRRGVGEELKGALANHHRLRRFLLTAHGQNPLPSLDEFQLSPYPDLAELSKEVLTRMPEALVGWTIHSRREYRISAELQAVLQATSLEGVTWQDVEPLPHLSFALSLEQPFLDHNRVEYDFILISTSLSASDEDMTRFDVWPCKTASYVPLTPRQKDVLRGRADRSEWRLVSRGALERIRVIAQHTEAMGFSLHNFALRLNDHVLNDTDSEDTSMGYREDILRINRLVVGFCLYLDTLPPGSPHLTDPNRVPLRGGVPGRGVIVDEMEVCNVNTSFKLTREDRIGLGLEAPPAGERAPYELCWHFRRAHKRRPPGQGNNPEAQRTVKVKGTIVRADRAEDPGAPGGAFVEI